MCPPAFRGASFGAQRTWSRMDGGCYLLVRGAARHTAEAGTAHILLFIDVLRMCDGPHCTQPTRSPSPATQTKIEGGTEPGRGGEARGERGNAAGAPTNQQSTQQCLGLQKKKKRRMESRGGDDRGKKKVHARRLLRIAQDSATTHACCTAVPQATLQTKPTNRTHVLSHLRRSCC